MLWMCTLVLLLTTTTIFEMSTAFAQTPGEQIAGKWMSSDESAVIKINPEGDGTFSGTLVWLKDGNQADVNNPDEALKGRNLVGTTILTGFAYNEAENAWMGGKIYDYQSGNSYDCKMWIEQDETLSVRGFMGLSIIGRTSTWTVFTPNMEAYLSR